MFKNCIQLACNVARGFLADRCLRSAAALAFCTLFALVPILVLVVLIFNALPVSAGADHQITAFLLHNFLIHSKDTIQQHLQIFLEHAKHLSILGLFMLVCVAVMMVFTMERAFDEIWRIPRSRHGLSGFFMYWSVLTLLPVLVSVGLFMVGNLSNSVWLQDLLHGLGLQAVVSALIPFLLIAFAFFLLYLTLPHCKVPMRSAWLSSLVATICFFAARFLYGLYIKNVMGAQLSLYGALSVLPVFLMWIYWNWVVILLGVEVGYHDALLRQREHGQSIEQP